MAIMMAPFDASFQVPACQHLKQTTRNFRVNRMVCFDIPRLTSSEVMQVLGHTSTESPGLRIVYYNT